MFGSSRKSNTNPKAVEGLLSRGVEEVFVRENLERKLKNGKPLRVKLGFDPTGHNIHIGRAIVLRKLREFQKLGHTAVFVVGDFTARIGDPSDKLEKRPMLTEQKIRENLATYKKQVGKILDLSKAEFLHNSTWLSKLNFAEIAELSEGFSIQQMSARRNFKERMGRGEEVSLREFLYPLMQGYDSVAVKADVEIGGFDQLFNLRAGRVIQRHYKQPEQDILTTSMLEGIDGRKMSTSWGNVISINDEAGEIFGKVMSVHDELILKYFLLCTDVSETEASDIGKKMEQGKLNPRDAKLRLAKEIVTLYHSASDAEREEKRFIETFSNASFPADAPVKTVRAGTTLVDAIADMAGSKSELSRLFSEGAVYDYRSQKKISDRKAVIERDMDLRIGKKRFVSIKIA